MKTTISSDLEIAPSNIIYFLSKLCRKAGSARKSSARIPLTAEMKSGKKLFRPLSLVPSQSEDSMRGLLAETCDILTRHFGGGTALAYPGVDGLHSASSRGLTLLALPGGGVVNDSFKAVAPTPVHRPKKISNTQSQMAELVALKRHEKPPENFLRDFIQEFHRRNEPSASKPRPSASMRKVNHNS